jgi:hypothetical protein
VAGLLMVPRLLDWMGLHLGTGDHARPSGA